MPPFRVNGCIVYQIRFHIAIGNFKLFYHQSLLLLFIAISVLSPAPRANVSEPSLSVRVILLGTEEQFLTSHDPLSVRSANAPPKNMYS